MDLKKYFKHKKIAVLMGGWSAEKTISRATGNAVSRALKRDGFAVENIPLTHNLAAVLKRKKIDFVFNALHGPIGEDGTVQGLLDIMGVPYSGSGVYASALCMNKAAAKSVWKKQDLPTPAWWEIDRQALREKSINYWFFEKKLPLVIKPASQGSAYGVTIVHKRQQIKKAIALAARFPGSVLIEQYIGGKEITVGIIGGKALEVIEIQPKGSFYDFKSKYAPGGSKHIIPAELTRQKRKRAQVLALEAYRVLECSVMARIDILLDHKGNMYLLEANTIPGMTKTSLLPDAARYAGMNFTELVKKIITLSLQKKR